jgi:hypothetical protein
MALTKGGCGLGIAASSRHRDRGLRNRVILNLPAGTGRVSPTFEGGSKNEDLMKREGLGAATGLAEKLLVNDGARRG